MKSSAVALLTFAVALLAVSCQEDEVISPITEPDNDSSNGMTISAVAESIGPVLTKAEMVYKFDVAWKLDDKICVRNDQKKVEFTLIDGEETTTGLFSSQESISGSVEGFYPSSIVTDGGLYWPDTLANNQTVPMYCKKNLSSTENQTFSFASLGSVLQIVFNTTQDDVVLRYVDIKDGSQTMSGAFTVDTNGKAVITDTDKIGITIDLGESGIALGRGANFFNIPVPAGDYRDLTLIFTTTDESQCVFKNVKLNIDHNTVGRLSLTGRNFKPLALPGVFSIGENKKVRFSKGNLYTRYHSRRNAWIWDFYHEQHSCNSLNAKCEYEQRHPEENDDEIDLFCWGYGDWSTNPKDSTYITSDQFRDWAEALPESKGSWRTLTSDEWCYLCAWDKVDSAFVQGLPRSGLVRTSCKVCGNENCIVIAPDGWDKDANPIQNEYSTTSSPMTWKQAEDAGLICLPAAGYRTYKDKRICAVGTEVYCWSITPDPKQQSDFNNSFCLSRTFLFGGSFMAQSSSDRRMGRSVRLVTDVE